MTTKSKSPAANGAFTTYQNQCLIENSTGIVPLQGAVIATGKFRADLLDYLLNLSNLACADDHFIFRHDGPNTVLSCGFRRMDGTEAVNVQITFRGWHPMSSIPVLDICAELSEVGWAAECARSLARVGRRKGKTILTSTHPRELVRDLRELSEAIDKLHDKVQDQSNWQPIPEDVVVSVEWWPILLVEVTE